MFQPAHYGLYFSPDQVQQAQNHQDQEPLKTAWARLRQHRAMELIAIVQWNGLRYRFDDDREAGQRAVQILERDGPDLPASGSYIEQAAALMTCAQGFEMLRDHPDFHQQNAWLEQFAGQVQRLDHGDLSYVEDLWANSLNLVAAIVLEQEAWFNQAVERFQAVIRSDVHPEGYIRQAALDGPPGGSINRMLLATQALILCAEAASQAGTDLWAFNHRGVSALTPTPYLLYYYYYPEKWRWEAEIKGDVIPEVNDSGLDLQAVMTLYQNHAGFWEMAQRRSPLPDRQVLLDELRPVYDLYGGGLVTLTHAVAPGKKRRYGLF